MRPRIATLIEQRSTDGGSPGGRAARRRRGYTLLEVQVAFALLGIGLAGLCPLVVMQLRQVRVLEKRLQGQVVEYSWSVGTSQTMLTAQTYYLIPWQNPLARKLSGAAQVVAANQIGGTLASPTIPCDPGPMNVPSQAPGPYSVNAVELDATSGSQNVTAYVDVSAP
jgi:hypothetical protein